MGEIRVKATITNAMDEMRERRGEIAKSDVRTYEADAIVDTGTVRSSIPGHVKERLGVFERGRRMAKSTGGSQEAVGLSGALTFEILGRDTIEEALITGDEVRIGSTVVDKLDLHIDWINQRLIPNPAHPDQPVSKVK